MLDSIREIFDILDIDFEGVRFSWIKYKNEKDLIDAIKNGKCPVVDVLKSYYSSDTNGSHVMVATGIKEENGVKNIQLKNSFADNPNELGKVHFYQFDFNSHLILRLANNNVTILSSTHCSAPSAWPLKSNIIGFSQFWRKLLIFRTRNICKIERPFIK